ncbi:MAG TPA: carboxypeptidase-like regulatory domain-containing protein [Solirubrobacterales bacterium]|nr:carboxypeptidase-like regulatory domain-containing protein [Solirubrobacterales bacterium]
MAGARLTTIVVALCGALGLAAPSLATAGSVAGTVTAAGGGGIPGVEVCFRPEPEAFETVCAQTGSGGQYKAENLPGAKYVVRFDAEPANLNYVSEYYNDAVSYFDLDLFNLGPGENVGGLDAELAAGGSVGGTVTEEGTGLPIAGIRACAIDHEGIPMRCANTGAAGQYQLNGLPTGTYSVEYEGGNRVNYLREFYEDAETWAEATDVVVTAPGTTVSGIDAELAPGAQVLGHVSEVGSGAPREDVMVCAEEPDPFGYQACDWTDAAGDYAIRSIPAGTYLVAFELEYMPFGHIAGQWWEGAATAAEATPIAIKPPETRSGINGQLAPRFPKPKPEPIQVSLIQRPPPPKKCRKGFHKKKVRGKVRCVRKHKRHGKHRHHGGQHKFSR